jgi:hypothetical protein
LKFLDLTFLLKLLLHLLDFLFLICGLPFLLPDSLLVFERSWMPGFFQVLFNKIEG